MKPEAQIDQREATPQLDPVDRVAATLRRVFQEQTDTGMGIQLSLRIAKSLLTSESVLASATQDTVERVAVAIAEKMPLLDEWTHRELSRAAIAAMGGCPLCNAADIEYGEAVERIATALRTTMARAKSFKSFRDESRALAKAALNALRDIATDREEV